MYSYDKFKCFRHLLAFFDGTESSRINQSNIGLKCQYPVIFMALLIELLDLQLKPRSIETTRIIIHVNFKASINRSLLSSMIISILTLISASSTPKGLGSLTNYTIKLYVEQEHKTNTQC